MTGIPRPLVGDRYILVKNVERLNGAFVGIGATGVIVRSDYEQIGLKLDVQVEWLGEWGNVLEWYGMDFASGGPFSVEDFHAECEKVPT